MEAPLLGAPEYDALIIHNPRTLLPGCRIADPSQTKAQSVLDWAAGKKPVPPYIHFELDAGGSGTLSGIHCKIEGDLALAKEFFRAAGEPERTEAFLRRAEHLPEWWYARYTGVFPGRDTNGTRMEIEPFSPEARKAMSDPGYLRRFFDEIGFGFYDDAMLSDFAALSAIDTPVSIQLDFLPDASFLPVLSLLSMYENVRPDVSPKGNVLPCMSMVGGPIEEQFPNMLKTPLEDILDGKSTYMTITSARVGDFMEHNPECGICEYRSDCCGGCRAIAVRDHPTDYLSADLDTCLYFKGGWKEKKDALLRKIGRLEA